jgi:hypothetical protein
MTIAPPQASRYRRPSLSSIQLPSARTAMGSGSPGLAVIE